MKFKTLLKRNYFKLFNAILLLETINCIASQKLKQPTKPTRMLVIMRFETHLCWTGGIDLGSEVCSSSRSQVSNV